MTDTILRRFDPSREDSCPPFVFAEDAVLAINVALATRRPLLLRGPNGSGKSALARAVAAVRKCELYTCQLTSSTTAAELLYYFDQGRYLHDAQMPMDSLSSDAYVGFGCLGVAIAAQKSALVLIEDIDIAAVSVQRDLLQIIGSRAFTVKETFRTYSAPATVELLFVLTTEERERLPEDLVRRSVVLTLASPSIEQMIRIGKAHHNDVSQELLESLAIRIGELHAQSGEVLTAGEYLNVLEAVLSLGASPDALPLILESVAASTAAHAYSDPAPLALPQDSSAPSAFREYRQGSYDVFLSYAREDLAVAQPLAKRLIDEGWSVFWDRRIEPGEEWEMVIEEALNSAKCVVVLWSNSSVRSRWVRVEAADGEERNILVPAMIERVKLPLQFRSRQSADLTVWADKQEYEPAIAALLSAVRRTVDLQR